MEVQKLQLKTTQFDQQLLVQEPILTIFPGI